MEAGLRADGKPQPSYHPNSLKYKRRTPISAGDTIKLKDTGDFHRSVIKETKETFSIFGIRSHDSPESGIVFTGDYTKGGQTDLEKEYGPIFGLVKTNLGKMRDITFTDLVTGLRAYWK